MDIIRRFSMEGSFLLLNLFGSIKMRKRCLAKLLLLPLLLMTLSNIFDPSSVSAKSCEQWIVKVASVEGKVEAKRSGETLWQQVRLDDTFCEGDTIRVMDESRADLLFSNQPLLRLDQNSVITIAGVEEEESGLSDLFRNAAKIDLVEGAAHFFSRLARNLEVRTAFVNAGVEGTEFFIKVEDNQTILTVFEGKVLAANEAGSLSLVSGQSAVAEAGKAPVLRVVVKPRDSVTWALYYPPVLYRLDTAKEGVKETDVLTSRAAQLLSVGRVDEAIETINQALSIDPANSDAFALQTIIAVVQNRKEEALSLAAKAVKADPKSATAQIALSYAQQANFDLSDARASTEEAVRLDPENTLAWARLAELWSSFGNLDKALENAQKAVSLDPDLSRTQTVLGFVYLTQIKTAMSREAFNKAIELDQGDSLPRLGLGLAKIRDGELEDGRRDIEIAASLDSSSSLIRSYLGKSYYEEKRSELAGREYAIAKELDPNDPTPWFYDAIRKQTINEPVEALHDLQKAIELNDNRAVYRSKLLLDSDLAARSASQARIYSDLGFQQRALVEGYSAVNVDPTNYSAHRFLSDTYSVLPRHEIARVSELLQSQLLQPSNTTPIQPTLAESNLFLISSSGAAANSFNEFNPMFNRNRAAVQASGLIGEDNTWGGEGVVSGIYDRLSMSAGYSHFESDGWRTNADQEDDIANIFAQYEITHKTSIQAEYRSRENKRGDLELTFFSDDQLEYLRQEDETSSFRLGFNHEFGPGSNLIGNFQYSQVDRSLHDEDPDPDFIYPIFNFDLEGDDEASSGELSYLLRSEHFNLVAGGGYFNIKSEDQNTFSLNFGIPPSEVLDQFKVDFDTQHTNFYLYSYIKPLVNLAFTVGGSGDFYQTDDDLMEDENQFNPKLGMTWELKSGTTLRAAAFRVLKRTLITDQTLEPTQVAGFNQFFDEVNATDYWRYGGAVDQKFSENIFGGIEYTYRSLEVPYIDYTGIEPATAEASWNENLLRAYFFWTPLNTVSMTAEYFYEKLDRDEQGGPGATEARTHYFPLGIKWFHPTGLGISLKGTYINQEGKFERKDNRGFFEDGEDDFWLIDVAMTYRLPKRYGFFTVGANNIFDEEFQYFDTDWENPRYQPGRFFFARVTIAFP